MVLLSIKAEWRVLPLPAGGPLHSIFVGVARFELATPCSQSRCADRAALHPDFHAEFNFRLISSQVKRR